LGAATRPLGGPERPRATGTARTSPRTAPQWRRSKSTRRQASSSPSGCTVRSTRAR
jgi:hypothetical protein